MDAATLSNILGGFLAANSEVRRNAEESFKELKKSNPDLLAGLLCQVLEQDADVTRRQQAAISFRNFLREFFLNQEDNAWAKMQVASREAVKSKLLSICLAEQAEVVKKAVADIVVDLGETLLHKNQWPELPAIINGMLTNPDVMVQIVGLDIAASLEPALSSIFVPNLNELSALLQRHLETRNPELASAAAALIGQLVVNESRQIGAQLEVFIMPLIQIVSTCDEKNATSILQTLIEIAAESSTYFKNQATTVMPAMLHLANLEERGDDVRQLAVEFVLTFIENKHKSAAKIPGFLDSVIDTLLSFLLEVEEDSDWFSRDLSGEEDEEAKNYDVGEYGLDRIAAAVDSDVIMPIIFAKVGGYLAQSDWKHKVAGIIAICQTGEYMSEDKVETQLGEVINMLIGQTRDEHYRVRFAACRALAQIALDHQPFAQENFHSIVLPAVIERFDDPVARVQAQAFAAFVNYAEEVDLEDLLDYIPIAMEKIFVRLDPSFSLPATAVTADTTFDASELAAQQKLIREQCITSVAVIAGVLGEKFMEFCPKVLPFMKQIVSDSNTYETRQMRGRALECLSIIAYSVGFQQVESEAIQIVSALIALYKTEMEADDPVREYVYEALRRMAAVMGRSFSQFNGELVDAILRNLRVDPTAIDVTSDDAEDFSIVCSTNNVYSGVKTSKLEAMEKDLHLLSAIVENTKGNFAPYIQQTMNTIIPLLELKHSDSIRRMSLLCVADLIGAARDGQAPSDQIQKWVLNAMEIVVKVVHDDTELICNGIDHLSGNVAGLARCLENAGKGVLTSEHVKFICSTVWQLIQDSSTRRTELDETKQRPEVDEEAAEQFDDEKEREQLFRETCLKVLESVMLHHPQQFIESSAETIENVKAYMEETRSADDRSLGCFVCCDILNILGTQGIGMIGNLVQKLVLYMHDPDVTVRQAACYAMNLCMGIQGVDPNIVVETARRLVQILSDPKAFSRENRAASENAVSALLTIVLSQSHAVGPQLQEYANLVVSKLPLSNDEEEAQKVHKKFVTAVLTDENNATPNVLWGGANQPNVAKIVTMIAEIYKSPQSDDATDLLIRQLVQKLGTQTIANVVGSARLSESQKRGLKKIERDFKA